MMKRFLKFLSVVFVCLSIAMQCDEDIGVEKTILINGIEVFNVNNEERIPFISDEPIKKEAFMLGVKWITEESNYDKYVSLQNIVDKKIFCNNNFDIDHPAGSNVSSYFVKAKYTFQAIDEGFVLLTIPQAGQYSFKVVFYCDDGTTFEFSTPTISLY